MLRSLALALALLAATACYATACRFWPYAACGRCTGTGKLHSPGGRAWRNCPRCRGTGRRLRLGLRVLRLTPWQPRRARR